LFGLREVWSGDEFVKAIVESMMLVGESMEFLVGLQQLFLVGRLLAHAPPPYRTRSGSLPLQGAT
jgi:hypothetical protein